MDQSQYRYYVRNYEVHAEESVIVFDPRMNPPHSHRASELPMFDGITVNRLVMTVAPQKLI